MLPQFERTANLIGGEKMNILLSSRVLIFGVGGVGSYAAEALCRAGVGSLTLADGDVSSVSNINRQLFATLETVGEKKTEAAKNRLLSINPECRIKTVSEFATPENIQDFFEDGYDFCIDAIDETDIKVLIALICREQNIPLIASMGTGNKISSDGFTVTDISKTRYCPLCRTMRKKYREAGLGKVTVLYSDAPPLPPVKETEAAEHGTRRPPASISFVPSVAGLKIAEYVVRSLTGL